MTSQDKDLLLRDLCTRLPYNPYCHVKGDSEPRRVGRIEVDELDGILLDFWTERPESLQVYLSEVRPYLRPMSSMTEEEKRDWEIICSTSGYDINESYIIEGLDWLNAHHFDYRGLIEKGLAFEAPVNMYTNK